MVMNVEIQLNKPLGKSGERSLMTQSAQVVGLLFDQRSLLTKRTQVRSRGIGPSQPIPEQKEDCQHDAGHDKNGDQSGQQARQRRGRIPLRRPDIFVSGLHLAESQRLSMSSDGEYDLQLVEDGSGRLTPEEVWPC